VTDTVNDSRSRESEKLKMRDDRRWSVVTGRIPVVPIPKAQEL
jgi:hypothetical protein